ncbi:uncharacterized protein C19orf47 homolog isoform X2 [Alosa alosa]|uniref:uncharacterized protein C19orf47 homolog isoform X2 n=1 Tax=Alosa sapidissima TaxID=34773 RepID=UPI001C0908F8|nr:uncharacterized protein C19orf47 homolog isoform X2 [Alosa sapidissima]XP_048121553.1 uncharacterized protein C19orf47 homolog isoform X2 [Alosa alosa]
MASEKSATSEWIQFFKDAGIPPSLAVTYAVSFVDNRIQKNMLMDLSKDIMMDLGISAIGDIIAILKHAKVVYRQDMCKMATDAINSGQTSVQAELRRTANTPATRMIASALSRDSPPSTPAQWPDNRLSVTVSNKGAKGVASSEPAEEGNGLPVKRRRVTAEMEGKGLKRTSVFERLGAESKADTTPSAAAKTTGVFSRLGGGQEDAGWRDGPKPGAAEEEDDDSDGEGSVLQYAGVLKRPHLSTKKELAATKPAATKLAVTKPTKTALSRLGNKVKVPPNESSPPLPSSTSSVLEGGPKRSILQRLGKPPKSGSGSLSASTKPLHSDTLPLASPKVSSSTSAAGSADCPNAQMDAMVVSVFKRLGAKRT